MTAYRPPNEIAELLVMLVGRRTAMDLCAIAPSVTEDPPGKRDLHHRLTEVTDKILGPVPTMPLEALVERLEKAAPRLQKAWDDEDAPIIFAALAAMVADVHAPQDLLTGLQWERAEELFKSLNEGEPREPRPFNNDDPNDGSFKRFTCECGTCIEVTPTWRNTHNNPWWIETFCSEKCGWKARGVTLRAWAEDAEKPRG